MTNGMPLIVDLDGTLTPSDTLVESVIKLVKQSPFNMLRLPICLLSGKSQFKNCVAQHTQFSAQYLPYNESLLAYLRDEKAKGRQIVLATAAHRSIADSVAMHLGLFDLVLATDININLKGKAKLEAIEAAVGTSFVYAGDSLADLPIWRAAKAAILVGVTKKTSEMIQRDTPIEQDFPKERAGLAVWVRALRVHQWLKNLLLFVPLLTAFSFLEVEKIATMMLAFLAFSLVASATYIVNDLWDLDNDRAHPRKRQRPFANARLPISHGLVVAVSALALAFALAATLPTGFLLMLVLYLVLTSIYSWVLKEYVLLDVLMLSILYTLRILAGSVAIGVAVSSWLMAFSVFIFLSLALVKRCAELVSHEHNGVTAARGRDYRVTDLVVLWPLGVGAALSSVVVFGLFISAPDTQSRYATPQLLWLVAIGLIYWLARLWIKTSRSEMHDDPIIYAIKDRGSRVAIMLMMVVMLVAQFWIWPFKS